MTQRVDCSKKSPVLRELRLLVGCNGFHGENSFKQSIKEQNMKKQVATQAIDIIQENAEVMPW